MHNCHCDFLLRNYAIMFKLILLLLFSSVVPAPIREQDDQLCIWDWGCEKCIRHCYFLVLKPFQYVCVKDKGSINGHVKSFIPPRNFASCLVLNSSSSFTTTPASGPSSSPTQFIFVEVPSSSPPTAPDERTSLNFGHYVLLVIVGAIFTPLGCCLGGFVIFHLSRLFQMRNWKCSCSNPFSLINRSRRSDGNPTPKENTVIFKARPARPPPPTSQLINLNENVGTESVQQHEQTSSELAEVFYEVSSEINGNEGAGEANASTPSSNPFATAQPAPSNENITEERVRRSARLANRQGLKKEDLEHDA